MDSKRKSFLKTISWRIIAVLTSLLIIYLFTYKLVVSLKITIVAAIVSTIEYYFHERLWKSIK